MTSRSAPRKGRARPSGWSSGGCATSSSGCARDGSHVPEREASSSFRSGYADAFARYLAAGDESTLQAAYELGRDAVARDLSVLDLALVHHEALRSALAARDVDVAEKTAAAAR